MPRQTAEIYRVARMQDTQAQVELNALLARLTSRLDKLEGLNGTPAFHSAVDMRRQRLTNLGSPTQDTDAVSAGLALTRPTLKTAYDAGQVAIINLPAGTAMTDAVNVGQLTDAVGAVDLSNESFVVVAVSPTLTSERALAAEATVLLLTDGGAGATLTISVVTNGITDAKLRQSAAVSVIGRSANSSGNVADIAAGANGNVLRRAANVVGFGQVALNDATNAVTGTLAVGSGGTGLTGGTSGGIPAYTGAATIASSAALAANQVVLGGGAGTVPATLGSLGTTVQVLHGNAGGAPTFAAVSLTADVSGILPAANGGTGSSTLVLASGVYTPTLFNTGNLDASTAYECQYLRVGATVSVSGRVDVNPTLTATSTQLGISLPVASTLGATEDLAGAAFASGIAGQGAAIRGDAANARAEMIWVSTDISNQAMYFTFSYQVI